MKVSHHKTKKRIQTFIEDLQWLFNVQNFERTIVYSETDQDESAATVLIDKEYQRITITIYPCFFEYSLEQQRGYLLHELCHMIGHDLAEIASGFLEGKHANRKQIQAAEEQLTSSITMLMNGLLQGRMSYARKGYARYLR